MEHPTTPPPMMTVVLLLLLLLLLVLFIVVLMVEICGKCVGNVWEVWQNIGAMSALGEVRMRVMHAEEGNG